MPAIFILKNEPPRKHKVFIFKHKFFIFLKNRYFVVTDSVDMNVCVLWETFVGFPKSAVLKLFPKCSQNYANLNVKSKPKFSNP